MARPKKRRGSVRNRHNHRHHLNNHGLLHHRCWSVPVLVPTAAVLLFCLRSLLSQTYGTSPLSLLLKLPDAGDSAAAASRQTSTTTAKPNNITAEDEQQQQPLSSPSSSSSSPAEATTNNINNNHHQQQTTSSSSSNATGSIKIVGFTDAVYKDIAMMWYDRLSRLGYTEHVIVVTDDAGLDYFTNETSPNRYRFEPMLLPPPNPDVWQMKYGQKMRRVKEMKFAIRWKYILDHLRRGVSIVLTDVDNIFNRRVPLTDFLKYDVIHAYEGRHPTHIYEKHGYVVCGGMGFFKASDPAIRFVEMVVAKCGDHCDDQIVLNELIADLNIEWDRTDHLPPPEERVTATSRAPSKSMTGYCEATGHSVFVWERNFAYRGVLHPEICPVDNWVAMPFPVKPENKPWIRASVHVYKLEIFEQWDAHCGKNNTAINVSPQ